MLRRWYWSKEDLRRALAVGAEPHSRIAGAPRVNASDGSDRWHYSAELAYSLRWFIAEGYVRFR